MLDKMKRIQNKNERVYILVSKGIQKILQRNIFQLDIFSYTSGSPCTNPLQIRLTHCGLLCQILEIFIDLIFPVKNKVVNKTGNLLIYKICINEKTA